MKLVSLTPASKVLHHIDSEVLKCSLDYLMNGTGEQST
jgi:hypothetical protein